MLSHLRGRKAEHVGLLTLKLLLLCSQEVPRAAHVSGWVPLSPPHSDPAGPPGKPSVSRMPAGRNELCVFSGFRVQLSQFL